MGIFQVRTEFSGTSGTPYLNTLYFDSAVGSAQQCVDAVGAFWGAVDAQCHQDLSWVTEADVEEINEVTGQPQTINSTTPASGSGALTGDILPTANQALVAWTTSNFINGRRVRGRTFIPAIPEVNAVGGLLATTARNAIQTAADALISDINTQFVIWHRPVLGAGGDSPTVQTASVRSQFAVLRSRRD